MEGNSLRQNTNQLHEIKGTQIGKGEAKLSLFEDDMILYRGHPKDAIRKVLELINELSKISGLIYRNMLHFLTMKCQNKIPLNIMPKDFPGGTVDGNLLATTGDTGSISGQGRFHMPQSS